MSPSAPAVPAPWLALLVGLVQGLIFWWLQQGAEQAPFPAPWSTVLTVLVVMLPLVFSPLGAFLSRDARLTWGTLGVLP